MLGADACKATRGTSMALGWMDQTGMNRSMISKLLVWLAAARSLHRGPTSEPMGHALFSLAHVCLSAFFGWAFYVRYWKWRECIEQAASSCITPEGDSLIEGGSFWLIPSVLFAVAAVRRMWRWRAAQQAHARDVRNARA